jgi:hypothetical protein
MICLVQPKFRSLKRIGDHFTFGQVRWLAASIPCPADVLRHDRPNRAAEVRSPSDAADPRCNREGPFQGEAVENRVRARGRRALFPGAWGRDSRRSAGARGLERGDQVLIAAISNPHQTGACACSLRRRPSRRSCVPAVRSSIAGSRATVSCSSPPVAVYAPSRP